MKEVHKYHRDSVGSAMGFKKFVFTIVSFLSDSVFHIIRFTQDFRAVDASYDIYFNLQDKTRPLRI